MYIIVSIRMKMVIILYPIKDEIIICECNYYLKTRTTKSKIKINNIIMKSYEKGIDSRKFLIFWLR